MSYRAKIQELDTVLSRNEIDLQELKRLCFHGIPDSQGKRALCWKLLLNYLPISKQKWNSTLTHSRGLYKQFVGN